MHIEEFKAKLNLQYTFGMRRTDGASRRYHDKEMGIGCETHTSYNDDTQEWGKGETLYYFESDPETYSSIEKLHDAYIKKDSSDHTKELK